ncbi:MAG: hypothetical protein ACPLRX_07290 [Candidatus Saccharicenans sp.]
MINFVNQLFELNVITVGIETFLYVAVAVYLVRKNKGIFSEAEATGSAQ